MSTAPTRLAQHSGMPLWWLPVAGAALLILVAGDITDALRSPGFQTWSTIFVSLSLQALPFLVLGATLCAAVAAFVPSRWLTSVLPRRPALAVPLAGAAGALMPGRECPRIHLCCW